MLDGIKRRLQMYQFRKLWRRKNTHNATFPMNVFDVNSVSVGNHTYGPLCVLNMGTGQRLKIGHYCSIATDVIFALNAEHYLNRISTFPFKVRIVGEKKEAISKGDIIISDDVWIGNRAMIMSGVNVGQGAVIAAGAIVTRDVPPYAIVGGVPAKVIRYRFEPEIVEKLLEVRYDKLSPELIRNHLEEIYEPLEMTDQLSWLFEAMCNAD